MIYTPATGRGEGKRRDCIDIAVKIAFELIEAQRDGKNIQDALNEVSGLSNQEVNAKLTMKNSAIKGTLIRGLQCSSRKIRRIVMEVLHESADIYGCVAPLTHEDLKVIQIRNGKKVNKEKVYFPGYIMVKANLGGEMIHIIRSITNVIGFLGETKGGDPVPLRKSEVNRMLGKVDELAVTTDAVAIPFVIGETIKVIDGPFNGFNGTVEKINEEKRKLEVMVKIFGRKTPLELSYMQVEKV